MSTTIIEDGLAVTSDLYGLSTSVARHDRVPYADMANVVGLLTAELARLTRGEPWILLAPTYQIGVDALQSLGEWIRPGMDVLIITPGNADVIQSMRFKPCQVQEKRVSDEPWFTDEELALIDSRIDL